MDKKEIRTRLLAARRSLSVEQASHLSALAQQQLLSLAIVANAGGLALYSPIHNEVDTQDVFRFALGSNKRVYYPRACGSSLVFVQINSLSDLKAGRFGVMEPASIITADPSGIDVLLVPGVAFDRSGHRLGYGRGYYDRFLAETGKGIVKIGFCYSFQLCDALPDEEHDQRLDGLVTDAEVISCCDEAAGLL